MHRDAALSSAHAHSALLEDHVDLLRAAAAHGPIVDLACGSGRNGLFLCSLGLPVIFADVSQAALDDVAHALRTRRLHAETWQVDLEQGAEDPFQGRRFAGALVFRYLHRPLLPHLKAALLPGGLLVYETFTVRNKVHGRPSNPDFLLREGELAEHFADWSVRHSFEAFLPDPDREVAQFVCRKTPL